MKAEQDHRYDPQPRDGLHRIGTVASILRYVTQDNAHFIVRQGHQRFCILEFLDGYPFYAARVQLLPDADEQSAEIEARSPRW